MPNNNMTATGINDAIELVKSYSVSLRTLKPLFEAIEEALEDVADTAVATQKSAIDDTPYKSLTATTQKITGKGPRDALKSRSLASGRLVAFKNLGQSSATLTTSMPYASIHQYGAPNNKFNKNKAPIPARPFLPLLDNGDFTTEFQERMEIVVQEWLESRTSRRR